MHTHGSMTEHNAANPHKPLAHTHVHVAISSFEFAVFPPEYVHNGKPT